MLFGGGGKLHDFVTESALASNFWLWTVAILFCMPLRRWAAQAITRHFGEDPRKDKRQQSH